MKKPTAGCEIQAIGINYAINKEKKESPFRFLNRVRGNLIQNQVQEVVVQDGGGAGVVDERCCRKVLKDVNCRAKPWEILAIVGPSGAGKSSLLEILAGKITPQSASIFVNQKPIDKASFKKISGYVTQKDTLFPLLTVEETLMFNAKLRLRLPESELVLRVKGLMEELGLIHVSATRVGDERIRGISGGERRRVSIGVEVIHDPRVLILDEPTSGLDSNSALQIIDMLKKMAEIRGRTIILSIHQPGFRIVKLFNSILLMANGTVLHHGSVDKLCLRLSLMGLQIPLHVNAVEFAIDSIETIQQNQEGVLQVGKTFRGRTGKRSTLQQLFQQSKVFDEDFSDPGRHDFANSRPREIVILSERYWKNICRAKELFACRSLQMLISGLVLGSIFFRLNHDIVGAQERVGLFAFVLSFLLTTTTEGLPLFLQEREILMKETSYGSYRISSYSIANGLVYLPFLLILTMLFSTPLYWMVGLNASFMAFLHFLLLIWLILYTANSVVVCVSALVPNFIVGNSMICGVMGSFFLFSGYFVSKNGLPKYWLFMHYISLFKYPFEGLLINEFSGSGCLQTMFGTCVARGEDVLKEVGFGEENRWRNVFIMVCYILVYRFIAYVILRCRCSHRGFKGIFI